MTKLPNNSEMRRESASHEQRHALVLQAWEAINSERELNRVLSAVADVLVPVVPFFGVAIIAPEARQRAPWAMHVVGTPKHEDEGLDEFQGRIRERFPAPEPPPPKKMIPYEGSELAAVQSSSAPYICDDLLKKEAWLPHEFKLAAVGVRAYTSIPLQARGRRIGVIVFSRRDAEQFVP